MRARTLVVGLALLGADCKFSTAGNGDDGEDMARVVVLDKITLRSTLEDANNFNAMFFLSVDRGWVGGGDGKIWRLSDAGKWEMVVASDKPGILITALSFADKSTGFAATSPSKDYAYILKTVDGGATWTESLARFTPSNISFSGLHFIDAMRGFAITGVSEGAILRTIDGGMTWEEVLKGGENIGACSYRQLNDVTSGPDGNIWVTGFRCQQSKPILLRSTDGGATFAESETTGSLSTFDVDVLENGDLWLTAFGAIARSTDGGKTWKSSSPDPQGDVPFSSVAFLDANRGIAARGNAASLFVTIDGAATWTRMAYDGEFIQKTFSDLWVGNIGQAAIGYLLTRHDRDNKGVLYQFQLPNP